MATIFEVLSSDIRFNILIQAIGAANALNMLDGSGQFTVFAPTDEAFNDMPEGSMELLLNEPYQLHEVLAYHIVPQQISSEMLAQTNGAGVNTVQGSPLTVKTEGADIFINNAELVEINVPADNGTIHVIDRVMLPPNITIYPR